MGRSFFKGCKKVITKYFEYGIFIIAEGYSNIRKCATNIERTLNSLLSQTYKPVLIEIIARDCKFCPSDIKKWICEITPQIKNSGVQHINFAMCKDGFTFSQHVKVRFRSFMSKKLKIKLILKSGVEKNSYLSVSHFGIINAGNIYSSNTFFENIRKDYADGKNFFVYYSNFENNSGEFFKTKYENLTSKMTVFYNSKAFSHFVYGIENENIDFMDIFKKINIDRKSFVKDNKYLIDNIEESESIFKKTKDNIFIGELE